MANLRQANGFSLRNPTHAVTDAETVERWAAGVREGAERSIVGPGGWLICNADPFMID